MDWTIFYTSHYLTLENNLLNNHYLYTNVVCEIYTFRKKSQYLNDPEELHDDSKCLYVCKKINKI